jgi:hypothetical protein
MKMCCKRWTSVHLSDVMRDVNTTHARPATTDWSAILVLGAVMSVIAALAVVALSGAVGSTVVIVGVVVIASVAGWVVSGRQRISRI